MQKTNQIYPGSPGAKEDFEILFKALEKFEQLDLSGVCLAYSFGARQALIDKANNNDIKAMILISPYPFPAKRPSPLVKFLLQTPLLGHFVLKKMAPKAIDKFLKDSASPQVVSENYRKSSQFYLQPEVLKKSILEKDVSNDVTFQAIDEFSKKKTPLLIIRGELDQTTTDDQVSPLKKKMVLKEQVMKNAGHALLWTNTEELAQIIHTYVKETL